jgi:hypothetical protein
MPTDRQEVEGEMSEAEEVLSYWFPEDLVDADNTCHDQFATSVSGVTREWSVQTPEGMYSTYDALGRDRMLYEIKTGYRFLLNTSPTTYALRERTIHDFIDQSQNQLAVAMRCGYPLVWVFNDSDVADFVDGFIQPRVTFVTFKCDEDR